MSWPSNYSANPAAEIASLRSRVRELEQRLRMAQSDSPGARAGLLRLQAALEQRLAAESLLTTISRRFINIRFDELDRAIDDALRQVGEFAGVDRTYLFQFSPDGQAMTNTHEWCAAGVEPQKDNLQDYPADATPWWMQRMRRGEAINIPSVADLPPEAAAERKVLGDQDIQSLIAVPLTYGGRLAGFFGFDSVRTAKTWAPEDIALVGAIGEIFVGAIQRRKTEQALRESEARFAAFMRNTPAAAWMKDQDGRYVFINATLVPLLQRSADDVVGCTDFDLLPRHVAEQLRRNDRAVLQSGQPIETVEILPHPPHGQEHPWLVLKFPFTDLAGQRFVGGMAFDISEQKRTEEQLKRSSEQQRRLLLELDHRVRNNLVALRGLTEIAARGSCATVPRFAEFIRGRIEAMAAVHRLLSARRWSDVEVRALLEALIPDGLQDRFTVDGQSVLVNSRQAAPLGMVLQELMANSLKHGALRTDRGRVQVRWKVGQRPLAAEGSPNAMHRVWGPLPDILLEWTETGGPPIREPVEPGTGSALIDGLVRNDLRGEAALEYTPQGARHRLRLRLEPDAGADADL